MGLKDKYLSGKPFSSGVNSPEFRAGKGARSAGGGGGCGRPAVPEGGIERMYGKKKKRKLAPPGEAGFLVPILLGPGKSYTNVTRCWFLSTESGDRVRHGTREEAETVAAGWEKKHGFKPALYRMTTTTTWRRLR